MPEIEGRLITTIAWRGRILAADTQLTWSDGIKSFCRKLHTLPGKDGCIGIAGNYDDEVVFHQWWGLGEKIETWDSERMKKAKFSALYIDKWKDVWYYDDGPEKMSIEHEFAAIGDGSAIAIAGMHMGMTAKEAVNLASELTVNTNNYIDTYDIQTGKLTLSKWPLQRNKTS